MAAPCCAITSQIFCTKASCSRIRKWRQSFGVFSLFPRPVWLMRGILCLDFVCTTMEVHTSFWEEGNMPSSRISTLGDSYLHRTLIAIFAGLGNGSPAPWAGWLLQYALGGMESGELWELGKGYRAIWKGSRLQVHDVARGWKRDEVDVHPGRKVRWHVLFSFLPRLRAIHCRYRQHQNGLMAREGLRKGRVKLEGIPTMSSYSANLQSQHNDTIPFMPAPPALLVNRGTSDCPTV
ncbi:hypothetical protein GQ53DRAFT_233069 [Thozetella sp. PMI_491]|nr:hypothetical protein GQ53DRAFT_233069 [Thozetella sp. PMI_491]